MRRRASRRIEALKPPARPRSEVATTSRWVWSWPVPTSSGGAPGMPGHAAGERGQHALHPLRIGPRRLGLLLRAAQPRGRDHLHRRGDLLGRPDAADADPQVLQAGHPARLELREGLDETVEELAERLLGGRARFRPRRGSPSSTSGRVGRDFAQHRRLEAADIADLDACRDSRACRRRSTTTCSSTGTGANCGCFSSSVSRAPRASRRCVDASRSEANCAKRRHLAVLRELELDAAGDLLHRLDLRRRADPADRQPDIDRRAGCRDRTVRFRERSARR